MIAVRENVWAIRESVDQIKEALEYHPTDRILSDISLLSMMIDYFDATWPVVEAAVDDWMPGRVPRDRDERALMDAILDADGMQDDDDEPICDECKAKMQEEK